MRHQKFAKIRPMASPHLPTQRLSNIALARQHVIEQGVGLSAPLVEGWIERSWQRCLAWGHQPAHGVSFEAVSQSQIGQLQEQNRPLLHAAQTELDRLSRAIASTRYFALLTDANGMVIDTRGAIDARERRASSIARIGVDLSEQVVGTTAIGAVLAEQRAVWLHRGEHFFNDNTAYSCAGAPLFNPKDGTCAGMLDLTGIDVPERPELQHLAAQSARSIENNWIQQLAPALLLRINWAGQPLGSDSDGLMGLDADGLVVCANRTARQMTGMSPSLVVHVGDVFATAWHTLFDMANQASVEIPLWSGLHVQIQAQTQAHTASLQTPAATSAPALKAVETELIRRAMQQARGNVALAAQQLGISRATLYRKIAPAPKNSD